MSDSYTGNHNIVRIIGLSDDLQAKEQLVNLDHVVTANEFPSASGLPRLRIVTHKDEVEFAGITLEEFTQFIAPTQIPTLRAKAPVVKDEMDD